MIENKKIDKKLLEIEKLYPKSIDLSLDRLTNLLMKIGNPHLKLPKTIHISGTNGKGSTLAFLHYILAEHGYKVHRYISPHLINFNERINIFGNSIDNDLLLELIEYVEYKNDGASITLFEFITAVAFLAFSKFKADYLLLETGLGGEFDATNVVATNICAISPISIDHQGFLGKDITSIAQAKAGIIKANSHVFVAKQTTAAMVVINDAINKNNAKLFQENRNWHFDSQAWYSEKNTLTFPKNMGLVGEHQKQNASLALAIAQHILANNWQQEKIINALEKTRWQGRLQKITNINSKHTLYLDGAHNIDGAIKLNEFISDTKAKPCYLIIAMLKNRDVSAWLKQFNKKNITHIIATNMENGHDSNYLMQEISKLGFTGEIATDFFDALSKCEQKSKGTIFATGSLYFIGDILEKINGVTDRA